MEFKIEFEMDGQKFSGRSIDYNTQVVADLATKYTNKLVREKVYRAPVSERRETFERLLGDIFASRRATSTEPRQSDVMAVLRIAMAEGIDAGASALQGAAQLHKQLDKAGIDDKRITEQVLEHLRAAVGD
jgi:mannitol-specific phosphotransferase system IIBC component